MGERMKQGKEWVDICEQNSLYSDTSPTTEGVCT